VKHFLKINLFIILCGVLTASFSRADVSYFKGSINLDPTMSQDSIPQKLLITIKVTTNLPADGTVKNQSHLVTTPNHIGTPVVCEYLYTFSPSQVDITITDQNNDSLGSATAKLNVSGTIYTDGPDSDVNQCQMPALDTFPVNGTLDTNLETLSNFQISSKLLLSLEPGKQAFKNSAIVDLKNHDSMSPVMTGFAVGSIDTMNWTIFGTDATTKTGSVTFTPSKTP
jgi:hypothetical protein